MEAAAIYRIARLLAANLVLRQWSIFPVGPIGIRQGTTIALSVAGRWSLGLSIALASSETVEIAASVLIY